MTFIGVIKHLTSGLCKDFMFSVNISEIEAFFSHWIAEDISFKWQIYRDIFGCHSQDCVCVAKKNSIYND